LLIGGGSTASEYIKNIALLGISSGQKGKIQILDEAKVSKFDFNSYFPLKLVILNEFCYNFFQIEMKI